MTQKNAKKAKARARQAKTGVKYQSALRIEGRDEADSELTQALFGEPLTAEQEEKAILSLRGPATHCDVCHQEKSPLHGRFISPRVGLYSVLICDTCLEDPSRFYTSRTILKPNVMAGLFASVGVQDHTIIRVWLNIVDFADVRYYCRDHLDPTGDMTEVKKGIQGVMWNAQIRTTKKIKPGFVVLVTDEEAERTMNADLDPDWEPTYAQLVRTGALRLA